MIILNKTIHIFSPKYDLPLAEHYGAKFQQKSGVVCHNCGEPGHKSIGCPKLAGHSTHVPIKIEFNQVSSVSTAGDVKPVFTKVCMVFVIRGLRVPMVTVIRLSVTGTSLL